MAAPPRSQSTTSLAKLYHSPAGQNASLPGDETDFCNAFWGPNDKGYDVLMARLRGAGRTMEELRLFWKERINIEEEYAKRLSKLSKQALGRDEIGDLKQCFETLRTETERQSVTHQSMVTEMKTALEAPSADFILRLGNLKRGFQASIEKQYKNKAMQEQHVNRARERYEQDCLKINSYTAQLSLVQGKEQEKIQQKLEKSQSSVGQNEQDFKNFVRALEGTAGKWELEWKAFCDHVQDLEEDRLDFVRDNVWAYANAVSQVCVEDDSSCERIRCGLEAFDSHNDMVHFVQGWGTGSKIPDAPRYINYSAGEAYPTHQTFHPARFTRISSRPIREADPEAETQGAQDQDHGQQQVQAQPNGQQFASLSLNDREEPRQAEQQPAQQRAPFAPAPGQPAPPAPVPLAPAVASPPMQPPPPEPKDMPPPPVPQNKYDTASSARTLDDDDPIARALADLRRDPPPSGSIRRGSSYRRPESTYSQTSVRSSRPVVPASPAMSQSSQRARVDTSLVPPAGGHTAAALARSKDEFDRRGPNNRKSFDYGNYADSVVGAHPASRPTSPSGQPMNSSAPRAPSPAMMQPPNNPASPVADEVLSQYHQAFPGERSRPASRAGSISSRRSRGNSFIAPPPAQAPARSPSPAPRQGFVGIGAGRSPSPQPDRGSTQPLGIALDGSGGVAHDSMAEQYRRQYAPQQQQPVIQQAPPAVQPYHRQSYQQPVSPYQQQPPPQQRPLSGYGQHGQQPPQQPVQQPYQHQQPPQQARSPYQAQQPPQQFDSRRQSYQSGQYANGQPQQQAQYQRAPSPQPQYQRQPSPQPHQYQRQPSPQPQAHFQPPQTYAQAQPNYYGGGASTNARQPSPQPQQAAINRSPSPQPGAVPENAPPTGQWSTTGLPVLFYVKALYDYNATSPAEFDFQAGDIIAVTSTPEDGWWSGELLDEARRVHGRTDFPSNFVCLF